MLNSQQSIGNRLVNSIGSLLLGVLVFIGSFVLLYMGEMRTDYSPVAKNAVEITEAKQDGDFVYLTGDLKAQQMLSDGLYLKQGDYIAVERIVEMYAWSEDSDTTSNDMTIYSYTPEWTESPQDSSSFDSEFGHENPEMKIRSERFQAKNVSVGDYLVDMGKVRLPAYEELKIDETKVALGNYETLDSLDGKTYIYDGYATVAEPEIGSIKISYNVIPVGKEVTVFGKADGKEFSYHTGENEKELYRMFYGTQDEALESLKGEYNMWGWIYKIIGFLVMWLGLAMILKPIIGVITFVAALLLTLLTSFILGVLHSWVGIIILIIVVIGVGVFVNSMRSAKPQS